MNNKMRNAVRFFGLSLELAPGFLEHLFKNQRAESSTASRSHLSVSDSRKRTLFPQVLFRIQIAQRILKSILIGSYLLGVNKDKRK